MDRLTRHLETWLGRWPAATVLDIVGSPARADAGWDGRIHPALGVASPQGAVLSVAPDRLSAVQAIQARDGSLTALGPQVPAAVGHPARGWYDAVFRWTLAPADLPDVGEWVPATDDRLPGWLRPFGGAVLAAFDDATGAYLAGVGIKRHDRYGREISVGTAEQARGRGLARRLVAQAARRVLDDGAVPTYLHDVSNVASARVAEAAGFPDHGWRSFGVTEQDR